MSSFTSLPRLPAAAEAPRWQPTASEAAAAPSGRVGAPSASERWQRHVRYAHGSVTERQPERQAEPLSLSACSAAGAPRRAEAALCEPQPPPARTAGAADHKLFGGLFTSPRDVEGKLARKSPAYPQAMQLLLGLISSLCSPGEEAGSYALAVESALRLAEAEFQQAVKQNQHEEKAAVARTANNYHELLSSVTGQLTQEREARRLVESQDAAMVAQLKTELALERQRREAVQQSLRSALAVKRMGRLDAMAAAGVAPPPGTEPNASPQPTVAHYEAQIASLRAEISTLRGEIGQLNCALRDAKASASAKPEPAPEPEPPRPVAVMVSSIDPPRANNAAAAQSSSDSTGRTDPTQLKVAQPKRTSMVAGHTNDGEQATSGASETAEAAGNAAGTGASGEEQAGGPQPSVAEDSKNGAADGQNTASESARRDAAGTGASGDQRSE